MNKKISVFAAVVLSLVTLSSQAVDTLSPGKLIIASDLTYPPYNYLQDNRPAGFDAEFMQLLTHEMHLTPVVKDTRFASLILGLKSNKFDVIASTLYITPDRAQQVNFIPYMQTGGSLIVKKGSAWLPVSAEDLCGKKVGSIKGGAWIPKLAAVSASYCIPGGKGAIDNREFPSSPEVAQALLSGAIDVQYEDAAVAKAIVEKTGNRLMISSEKLLYPQIVGLALNKNNPLLIEKLRLAFSNVVKRGQYSNLLKKYNVKMPESSGVIKSYSKS